MNDTMQIVTTVVAVLGTAGIWRFLETRIKLRSEANKKAMDNSDTLQYREELKRRVLHLEDMLIKEAAEKSQLMLTILKLTEEVATLKVKVEYLEKENQMLNYKK